MPKPQALPGFHVLCVAVFEDQGCDVIAAEVEVELPEEPAALDRESHPACRSAWAVAVSDASAEQQTSIAMSPRIS